MVCAWNRRTKLLVLERGSYHGYPATKVLLAPITGRRHQLRQEEKEGQHLDSDPDPTFHLFGSGYFELENFEVLTLESFADQYGYLPSYR